MDFELPPGATPLDADEMKGLIPTQLKTREEVTAFEDEKILEVQPWALGRVYSDCLSEGFIRKLHKRMYNFVWTWAGQFRKSDKRFGVHPNKIQDELVKLCGDTTYWIDKKVYVFDEIAARFHHRLISIQAFPDGNARHARLMTNILLNSKGQEIFDWGKKSLSDNGKARERYVAALQAADNRDFSQLLSLVRP